VALEFARNTSTEAAVAAHLAECDAEFEPPLSGRVELHTYARKLVARAIRFEALADRRLVGLVAAYCDDLVSRQAFITSVSVSPDWTGRGIALRLMRESIAFATAVGMRTIALEVGTKNVRAIRLYSRLGFAVEAGQDLLRMTLALPGPKSMPPP
jgi:ribosomal protein S18 acetylase RimI-like enzyme